MKYLKWTLWFIFWFYMLAFTAQILSSAEPTVEYGDWVLQDPLPNTEGNSDVRLLREVSYNGGSYQHSRPDDFIYDNSPLEPGDTVEVYHRVKGKKGELYNVFTVNGDAEAAKKVKNNITHLTEEGKSYSVEVYVEPVEEVVEEVKEVTEIPSYLKPEPKEARGIKRVNSLGDLNRIVDKYGDLYIQININDNLILQHKNEHGVEYTGIKLTWRF